MCNYPQSVIVPPPKIRSKQCIIIVNFVQIICELFCGRELLYINVGVGRGHLGHVGTIEDNRDDIVREDVEELLSDVVLAHTVLEGEVELVRLVQHLIAVFVPVTLEAPTVTKDINLHVFTQRLDKILSFTFCVTV